jgi:26S proteasome regulatory subunit N10
MSGKEQCVICIDNSEWMRNGDYNPTRMMAQQEAANLLCGRKTQSNPETTLAILSMAGSAPSVQVALTNDLGKLLSTLSQIKISGEINFSASVKVAQLVLKRRSSEQSSNKRIVAFIGSPLKETKEELEKLGLRLKKNNIAVDVVNFGEHEQNTEKLEAFINSVNNNDNSHLVTIPPGPHILADMLLSSPIISFGGGAAAGEGGISGGEGDFEFGFDPSLDPELAMVLRLSMEEENRRQERLRQEQSAASAGTSGAPSVTATTPTTTTTTTASTAQSADEDVEMDDDEALKQAIAMSLAESETQGKTTISQPPTSTISSTGDEMDEDEALKLALEMSKQEGESDENIAEILKDDKYMESLVGSLAKKKEDKDKKDEK